MSPPATPTPQVLLISLSSSHTAQENCYWLDFLFIITKNIKGYEWTFRWRNTQGDVQKCPEHRCFCPCGVSGVSNSFTNPELLETSSFSKFLMKNSLWRHGWLNHWPLGIKSLSTPSPHLTGEKWGYVVEADLIMSSYLVYSPNSQPLPSGLSKVSLE